MTCEMPHVQAWAIMLENMQAVMRRVTVLEEQLAVSEERDAKLRRDLVNITTSTVEEQSAGGITPGTAGAVGGKRPRHVGSKGAETDWHQGCRDLAHAAAATLLLAVAE